MQQFFPRLTDEGMYGSRYWYGANPLYQSGYGLPNCTCYAWGRYWEVTGQRPVNLPTGNAEDWFARAQRAGFNTGSVPALGAIACWYGPGDYAGHVAVVERILPNGDLITSNSGYQRPVTSYPPDMRLYFWTETCYKDDGYRSSWEASRGYYLQGFIYAGNYAPGGANYHWISITEYLSDYFNDDTINNCYCVASYLLNKGWTIEAICGLLGNAIQESFCSADMGEFGGSGYGILQWTPKEKLTEWLDSNVPNWSDDLDTQGYGECDRILWEVANNAQWFYNPLAPEQFNKYRTFEEFTQATDDVGFLADCFLYWYEHPADPNALEQTRYEFAHRIYDIFRNAPPTPSVPTGKGLKKMPVWMMTRIFR